MRYIAFLSMLICSTMLQAADVNFISNHFSGSGNCATCHDGLTDKNGNDVSIQKDWGASMMANATKDPFWRAKVASEIARNPQLESVINDKCTKCHAPMANYEAKKDGVTNTIFGAGGLLDPANPYHDEAMNGISCTVCHQITDDASLGTLSGFSGQYKISDTKVAFGQYINPAINPMLNNSGFTPTFSPHISDSKLCATCHNLKTPFVDQTGTIVSTSPDSEFPEQMVYSEWENSDFAKDGTAQSCQDCHMPQTDGVKISNRPRTLASRDNFSQHHLVGANTVMLQLLADNSAQLQVDTSNIAKGIDRARSMLQTSGAIDVVNATATENEVTVHLRVRNDSGHKLPTSYPSRRVFIHFTAKDSSGAILFESGRMNSDGSIAGVNADRDLNAFEPHYDEITSADQVQVYESIMGDTNGNVTYTLLRGGIYLKDNRIPPKGFDKYQVENDIRVAGAAFDDNNFNDGSDLISYRIPVTATGTVQIEAELIYQPLAYGFVADLYLDQDSTEVAKFKSMYDAQSLKAELIASTTTSVEMAGTTTPPAPEPEPEPEPVPAPEAAAPTVTLTTDATSVRRNSATTLRWSSTDADNCVAYDGWSGSKAVNGSESTGSIPAATTYTLTCSGSGGVASSSVTVTVRGR